MLDWRVATGQHGERRSSSCGGGSPHDAERIDVVPLLPKIVSVPLDADGKIAIPLPMINFTILGIAGDPADIGAKVQRVVHSRLVGSRIL